MAYQRPQNQYPFGVPQFGSSRAREIGRHQGIPGLANYRGSQSQAIGGGMPQPWSVPQYDQEVANRVQGMAGSTPENLLRQKMDQYSASLRASMPNGQQISLGDFQRRGMDAGAAGVQPSTSGSTVEKVTLPDGRTRWVVRGAERAQQEKNNQAAFQSIPPIASAGAYGVPVSQQDIQGYEAFNSLPPVASAGGYGIGHGFNGIRPADTATPVPVGRSPGGDYLMPPGAAFFSVPPEQVPQGGVRFEPWQMPTMKEWGEGIGRSVQGFGDTINSALGSMAGDGSPQRFTPYQTPRMQDMLGSQDEPSQAVPGQQPISDAAPPIGLTDSDLGVPLPGRQNPMVLPGDRPEDFSNDWKAENSPYRPRGGVMFPNNMDTFGDVARRVVPQLRPEDGTPYGRFGAPDALPAMKAESNQRREDEARQRGELPPIGASGLKASEIRDRIRRLGFRQAPGGQEGDTYSNQLQAYLLGERGVGEVSPAVAQLAEDMKLFNEQSGRNLFNSGVVDTITRNYSATAPGWRTRARDARYQNGSLINTIRTAPMNMRRAMLAKLKQDQEMYNRTFIPEYGR